MFLIPVYANAAATVTIVGGGPGGPFHYQPANLTVKPGEKVTWVNKTKAEHSVTPDPGFEKKLRSKDIEPGKSYSTVIKAGPGPLKYHCKYHPSMRATVVVSTP
jgi:plastocyanin